MTSILVTVLAKEHRLHPFTIKRYLRELGITTHRLRDPRRRNQLCAAVTHEQAEEFAQWREDQGFTGKPMFLEASA